MPSPMRAGLLMASSLATVAVLHVLGAQQPPTPILLAVAGHHEGERVLVQGFANLVQPASGAGLVRLRLAAGGAALTVLAAPSVSTGSIRSGQWVAATGTLQRADGDLVLNADSVTAAALAGTPAMLDGGTAEPPANPDWSDVTTHPDDWEGRLLNLEGTLDEDRLQQHVGKESGARNAILLGRGAWPEQGHVVATGTLRFDPACVCHRFDAAAITPVALAPTPHASPAPGLGAASPHDCPTQRVADACP